MKNLVRTLFFVLSISTSVLAHEFWLEPETFQTTKDRVAVEIKVGMNYAGNLWRGRLENLITLSQFHNGKMTSLISKPLSEPVAQALTAEPGQYLLGLTNENSFIELSATDFENYVISEGLEFIVEQRKKLGESESKGRELYRRCVKTLIQRGEKTDSESYGHIFGFPLEIVALDNPYGSKPQQLLTFKLLFQGQPLSGAKVMVWHEHEDELKRSELRTKADGKITFLYRPEGKWMLSVVHMERIEDREVADWQSYWGSYTFGF